MNEIKDYYSRFIVNVDGNNCQCTDTATSVFVAWEKGRFNETQNFQVLSGVPQNADLSLAKVIAKGINIVSEYLRAFHYNLLFNKPITEVEQIGLAVAHCRQLLGMSENDFVSNYNFNEFENDPFSDLEDVESGCDEVDVATLFEVLRTVGLTLKIVPADN
jgi:hypothetical protein